MSDHIDHGWLVITGIEGTPIAGRSVCWCGGGLEGDAADSAEREYRKNSPEFTETQYIETIVIRVSDTFIFHHPPPAKRELIKPPES